MWVLRRHLQNQCGKGWNFQAESHLCTQFLNLHSRETQSLFAAGANVTLQQNCLLPGNQADTLPYLPHTSLFFHSSHCLEEHLF